MESGQKLTQSLTAEWKVDGSGRKVSHPHGMLTEGLQPAREVDGYDGRSPGCTES